MRILYSRYFSALLNELYDRIKHALMKRRQTLILVPAQASFMIESGIIRNCEVKGFTDVEVISFEKLTERIGLLAGGRAVQTLDASGFAMLAKLAMEQMKDELCVLDYHDPSLHLQVSELIASLKNEQITLEQLQELTFLAQGAMQNKLKDIACIYRQMRQLAGQSLLDGRDLERQAAEYFGQTPYIQQREIIVFGFDVLPKLRMQTLCSLDFAAQSLTILAEAGQDGVLEKQWANIQRLKQLAQHFGLPVQMQPLQRKNGFSEEIDYLFEHLYQYPYIPYAKVPKNIVLAQATSREQEVQHVAAEILRYTCTKGYRCSDIGIVVGDVQQYEDLIEEIFIKAEIPFFLQGKRSLEKSSLWALLRPLLALLCRKNWRIYDALAYAKSSLIGENVLADRLVRYCRERGVKGYQLQKGLGTHAPEEIEEFRRRIFEPVSRMSEQMAEKNLSELLQSHLDTLGIAQKIEQQSQHAQKAGLLAQSRFMQQVYPAMQELLVHASILGRLPVKEYTDALSAGVQAKEISIIPPTTDEVVVGDVIHAIWPGKKILFVLGMNEGMLPVVPDETGLITQAEAQSLRRQQPSFPHKMVFEDQKAYLRKNLTWAEELHFSYNLQDGQPSYLVDRIRRLFPMLQILKIDKPIIFHRKALLGQLAKELRACADDGTQPGKAVAAYFAQGIQELGEMLAEVYAQPSLTAMSLQTARALYGAPRSSISRLEEYYRCPYRHFMVYGLRPEETEEYGEGPMEAGNYVHALMEEFAREAEKENQSWSTLDEERIEQIMKKVAMHLKQTHNDGIFTQKRYAFMEKRLREEAVFAAKAVRNQLAGTNAHVAGEELGFGGDILRLPTRFGTLTVRGKIDRIDEAHSQAGKDYIRVVDYKTGEKKFALSDIYYGVGLQLVVYLMAAQSRYLSLGKQIIPAGAFYFPIRLPYLEEGEEEGKRMVKFRMNGFLLASYDAACALDNGEKKLKSMNAEINSEKEGLKAGENCFTEEELQCIFSYAKYMVKQAAERIYGGELEVSPLIDAGRSPCDYCEYAAVCMVDTSKTVFRRMQNKQKEEIILQMQKRLEEER